MSDDYVNEPSKPAVGLFALMTDSQKAKALGSTGQEGFGPDEYSLKGKNRGTRAMTKEIWVTHTLYEKNADEGIQYFTDREALAESVMDDESAGGAVTVYKCIHVSHKAYSTRATIDLGFAETSKERS